MRLIIMLMAILVSLESAQSNSLNVASIMGAGQRIYASNGKFYLQLGTDGHLCIYTNLGSYIWGTGVHGFSGATVTVTTAGNLVVYDSVKKVRWSSPTHPKISTLAYKPARVTITNDGELVLATSKNDIVWSNKHGVIILDPNMRFMSSESNTAFMALVNPRGGFNGYTLTYINILSTMISVEDLVKASNYAQAKVELDRIWKLFPVGNEMWWRTTDDDKKYRTNVGSPVSYNSLRMLTDIVAYKLKNTPPAGGVLQANLRVILLGCTEGIQPKTVSEMSAGGGKFERRYLDARIKASSYRLLTQSTELFRRYVNAITLGKIDVILKFYELNNYCAPTAVSRDGKIANVINNGEVLNRVPKDIFDDSDMFYLMYPGMTPTDGAYGVATNAGFGKYSLISGGLGWYGDKPFFNSDDKWLITKVAGLGTGDINDIERRSYLPQWFQHEFFHYIYLKLYPHLRLETAKNHDWHTRSFWPADFQGIFEADYYQESLHKRIQQQKPLLAFLLKPTLSTQILKSLNLNINMFLNKNFDATQPGQAADPWHLATIYIENGKYMWRNNAGRKWQMVPDFINGRFTTTTDNPYPNVNFVIVLKKLDTGEVLKQIEGLNFNGAIFRMWG